MASDRRQLENRKNDDISKTAGPISAEFGVLRHNDPSYAKGYKNSEICEKKQRI